MRAGPAALASAALAFSFLVSALAANAARPKAGDVYEIRLAYNSESESNDGSSSSSHGNNAVIERVLEVTPEGLVLEYDLVTEEGLEHGRQDQWQFPFTVFKPLDQPMRLLNAAELEARIGPWLEHTEMPRSACGTSIFTWNVFRIECDPQSVIEAIAKFDVLRPNLRAGALFDEPGAIEPGRIAERSGAPNGATYLVELVIDPEWVRREQAQADVVVGEISGEPLSLEEALSTHASEQITGTITITFEADTAGDIQRRTKVAKVEIRTSDGVVETRRLTETVERQLREMSTGGVLVPE